jgi:hypothetical protein
MVVKSAAKIVLAGTLAVASLSPTLAATRHTHMAGACGNPSGRCIAGCDQFKWCLVYACANGQSTPVPFWRCYEPSGLCFAPHC